MAGRAAALLSGKFGSVVVIFSSGGLGLAGADRPADGWAAVWDVTGLTVTTSPGCGVMTRCSLGNFRTEVVDGGTGVLAAVGFKPVGELAGGFCAGITGDDEADGSAAAGLALGLEFPPPPVLASGVALAGVKPGRAPSFAAGFAAGLIVGLAMLWAVLRRLPAVLLNSSTWPSANSTLPLK